MLVFTRGEGQSFYVGDNVEITMEKIEGNKVRVSVNAPRNITIARKELIENTNKEKADRYDILRLRENVSNGL